jgi:Protein of unknown function (DUF3631)
LNAGYKRGATVSRCKDNGDLEEFNCFCPKGYAGLDVGTIAPTFLSRSITVRLERKTAEEKVDMWIAPRVQPAAAELRERCEGWAAQHVEVLDGHEPDLPGLINRAAEVWWALLSIAELAGDEWHARARAAVKELASGGDETDSQPDQVQLLADIGDAFGDEMTISTASLLAYLNDLDESPWGARRRGEGLDARGLARMLRPFKIRSRTVRTGEGTAGTAKGYRWEQFEDAFSRHLPEASQASQATQPAPHGDCDVTDATDETDTEGRPCEVRSERDPHRRAARGALAGDDGLDLRAVSSGNVAEDPASREVRAVQARRDRGIRARRDQQQRKECSMSEATTKACRWCQAPATDTIKDQWRTRMSSTGSGSVFIGGPGTRYEVCASCAERLTGRYLKTRVK